MPHQGDSIAKEVTMNCDLNIKASESLGALKVLSFCSHPTQSALLLSGGNCTVLQHFVINNLIDIKSEGIMALVLTPWDCRQITSVL